MIYIIKDYKLIYIFFLKIERIINKIYYKYVTTNYIIFLKFC